jgi:hypothetical protein
VKYVIVRWTANGRPGAPRHVEEHITADYLSLRDGMAIFTKGEEERLVTAYGPGAWLSIDLVDES